MPKSCAPESLKDRLIAVGLRILDQEGVQNLTLRRIAAQAGVSHAAPAHHFDGLPGLRRAIAICGFEKFFHALMRGHDPSMSPKDQFLTRTRNYVSFAESHEALFHVMFDELDKGDPKVRESAVKTYLALREVVRPLLGDADAARGELAVWAMTHGYVSLRLGQPRPSSAPFQAINMVDLLTTLIPSLNLTEPT